MQAMEKARFSLHGAGGVASRLRAVCPKSGISAVRLTGFCRFSPIHPPHGRWPAAESAQDGVERDILRKTMVMTMKSKIPLLAWLSMTFACPLFLAPAQADTLPPGVILGGVDLTRYCRAIFGGEFKAVTIGDTAGDWTCERNAGDRRGISVQQACEMQYGQRPIKAIVLGPNKPGAWRCFQRGQNPPRPQPVILGGVNLTAYCRATYGQRFKAIAIGPGAGDWVCARRGGAYGGGKPISVQTACEMQYQKRPIRAIALDQNDSGSWRCKG